MSNLNNAITFLFSNILIISLQAAIVPMVVLFINRIFKKQLNPRLSYLLWLLVLIRLALPVLPQSPISIFNVLDIKTPSIFQVLPGSIASADNVNTSTSTKLSSDLNKQIESTGSIADQLNSNDIGTTNQIKANNQSSWPTNLVTLFAYIWLCGVVIIIGYLVYINVTFANKIKYLPQIKIPTEIINDIRKKTGIKRNIRIAQNDSIGSPSVFGIVKCTILLPKGLIDSITDKTLYNILLHEFAHIKRNDLPVSWLSYILCALHWFNPIMWYSAFSIRRCQEVCADSYALSLMEDEEITSYGQTLIEMARKPSTPRRPTLVTAGINENKGALKDRIKNIAIFAKKRYRITFIGIVLFALIGVILCTSSAYTPKTPEEQMEFQNNIMLSVSSLQSKKSLQDINLKIHNYNDIGIWNCKIELYNGSPNEAKDNLVYTNSFIRIGSNSKQSFNIHGIDYDNTYIKLSYTPGFSLSKKEELWSEGHIKIFDKTPDINNWGAVTDDEIASFIKAKGISTVGVTKIYDFYTVVLFEKGTTTTGYYELWKDTKKNEVISRFVEGSGVKKSPVTQFGGTASGMYPFATIIINDPVLLALGEKIVIEGTGNTINAMVTDQRGYTLETRGIGDIVKILIYDKSNILIYDGEKSLISDAPAKQQ